MFLRLTTAIGALLGCLIELLFHSAGAQLCAAPTILSVTAESVVLIDIFHWFKLEIKFFLTWGGNRKSAVFFSAGLLIYLP